MIWLDTPPITTFQVVSQNKHHLRLEGPTAGDRVVAGMHGAFGGTFAAMGARLLRAPLPMPYKLIPIAMTAVGAGLAARGAGGVIYKASVDAKKTGLTFEWSVGPMFKRAIDIPWKELEDLEIVSKEVGSRDELSTLVYVLNVVRKDGSAFAMESFGTKAQANLRKKAMEAVARR